MRKPSSNIHQLIHKLTKEEKRKVTIHLQKLGKKGVEHIRLFKAIAKQEVYNEAVLKKTFRRLTLSIEKKRLYHLIMETMVQIHQKTDVEQELLTGLQHFQILLKKELYDQAQTELLQLKELAQQYELFHYLQLINEHHLKLENTVFLFSKYTPVSFEELIEKLNLTQLQHQNAVAYRLLKTQLQHFFRQQVLLPSYGQEIKKLMQHPLLQSFEQAKSTTAQLHFCQIHCAYNFLQNDFNKALEHSLKAIDCFERALLPIRPPEEYMDQLQNAITTATFIKREDVIIMLFPKLDQTVEKVKHRKSVFKLRAIEIKANWYIVTGNTKEGTTLIQENLQWLEQCSLDTSAVCYCFASLSFLAEHYYQTLQLLEMVLDKEKNKKHMKLKHLTSIFKLYCYFELSEFSLLESWQRSLYRKWQHQKEQYKIELAIIHIFKQLLKSPENTHKVIFANAYERFLKLNNNASMNERRILKNSSFLLWLESKCKQIPFCELLQSKNNL